MILRGCPLPQRKSSSAIIYSVLSDCDWDLPKIDLATKVTLDAWTIQAGCIVLFCAIAIAAIVTLDNARSDLKWT